MKKNPFCFLLILVLLCRGGKLYASEKTESKQKILEEFREKLINEEEIKKELEKNVVLTNEDLNILIKDDSETSLKNIIKSAVPTEEERQQKREEEETKKRIKAEEERLKKEVNQLKKEEERLRKEEEQLRKKAEKEKNKKEKAKLNKQKKELEKKKNELEQKIKNAKNFGFGSAINIKDTVKSFYDTTNKDGAATSTTVDSGVLEKMYNITDSNVSEEFLYSDSYKKLVNNRAKIQKTGINREEDIPVLHTKEKSIVNYQTSNIPQELLTYKRSEENKHIPTIILNRDLQDIAMKAIEQNNLSVLRGVIEQTKDPDFYVDSNRTLLFFAIESQKYILVRYLIYSGASINKTDIRYNNPLHISILNHNKEIVKLLVENGVDIDAQNADGDTPLILAIATSQDEIAVILMNAGANLKLRNLKKEDASDICKKNNKTRILQYIKDIIREEDT
ncbi:MAG: ankyrin repeat domain-containing protein [Rickettsiales bacterium]|jgi:hypothetical protein|nr:ankyrin repeat domain-containing protein [Rickettsiales bacterium]